MTVAAVREEFYDWRSATAELCEIFAARAVDHDREGSFVANNYEQLREAGVFSAPIDYELGGGGASYPELCELLRTVAKACPSTALGLSMHTHLVAASVFKLRRGARAEEMLQRRIAKEQLVLVSTGASDWVDSNGDLEKVEGGYRYTGRKVFASGSPAASVMVTTGRYCPDDGPAEVLHFPIAFNAEGVTISSDWDALGMRGTGSHTVMLDNVFVPDDKIGLRRPAGEWHPAWNVVLGVAMPLIVSVYRGIAEQARDLALAKWDGCPVPAHLTSVIGEMENQLTATQLAVRSMIELNDDYRFDPTTALANAMLKRKTLATDAAQATVRLACEVAGGSSFYRAKDRVGLEQLRRDIQAMSFHPLPKSRQHEFSARLALGLDPVS